MEALGHFKQSIYTDRL